MFRRAPWAPSSSSTVAWAASSVLTIGAAPSLLLTACGPSRGSSLVEASDAFAVAEYGKAVELARAASRTSTGSALDSAHYIEGMAEWRLGRRTEAADSLRLAARSADPKIAADALVSLGSLEFERSNDRAGADAYAKAAEKLEGAERRRAYAIAVRGYERAGLEPLAAPLRAKAGMPPTVPSEPTPAARANTAPTPVVPAPDAVVKVAQPEARETPQAKHYAIQAGAFSERRRAVETASIVRERAKGTSLGEPRIIEKRKGTTTVYVVQIGAFANRTVAGKAMTPFAKLAYTVEPYAE